MSVASTAAAKARTLRAGELAWVAVPPCAAAIVAAMLVLGPPIAHALLEPGPQDALWPRDAPYVFGAPEPLKHARVAIALLGPALLAGLVLASGRRRLRGDPAAIRRVVVTSQALLLVVLAAAVLGQNGILFNAHADLAPMFGPATLAGAAALTALLAIGMRRRGIAEPIARAAAETSARRIACVAAAVALTACWLLTAINSEATIGRAAFPDLPPWAMGDTLAILDGRTPLVDFYAIYGQVWAYVAAVPMRLLGTTITVFSIAMTSISALALLALYAVLRRIVGSSPLALVLYLPLLATGFMTVPSLPERPASNAQIFSVWPMRYAGPYLLAWLTARHIGGAAPRRAWLLFLVAGLVVVNNLEFGVGAVLGTLAALLCARGPLSWRAVARLAGEAASGLLGALLLVALFTLVRAGELPHLGFMLEYPRVFGASGAAAVPMPAIGLHLVLYATFAAAIGVAAVRFRSGEPDVLLTGMLAWSGIFGLLSGSYFAGRSDDLKLVSLFSAWCLALVLLGIVVVRSLARRGWRRPSLAELAVLYGLAVAVGSLHELPLPWTQVARLQRTTARPLYGDARARSFVGALTRRGEHVAILLPMGHRIARDLGLGDVAPYSFIEAMVTRRQTQTLIDAMRREGAHKLFIALESLSPTYGRELRREGFAPRAVRRGLSEWSD